MIAYEGTEFFGYQKQPNKRTVQSVLEKALATIHKGQLIGVTASGRTDTNVHAQGQVIHFDTPLTIPETKWPQAINVHLPKDVRILAAKSTSKDFHARFSAKMKEYRYRVLAQPQEDVFKRRVTYHVPTPLNIKAIQAAAKYLEGTHDFTSFCAAKTEVQNKVRTVKSVKVWQEDNEIIFSVIGNGFLYNMVRIIVGTLLEVGAGKREAKELPFILAEKNRAMAGKTAPGHGLTLWSVSYDESAD